MEGAGRAGQRIGKGFENFHIKSVKCRGKGRHIILLDVNAAKKKKSPCSPVLLLQGHLSSAQQLPDAL